jgi:hypothetical protein
VQGTDTEVMEEKLCILDLRTYHYLTNWRLDGPQKQADVAANKKLSLVRNHTLVAMPISKHFADKYLFQISNLFNQNNPHILEHIR